MGDLSLILGTVLSQVSIGTFITTFVVAHLLKKVDGQIAFKSSLVAFIIGVMGIGTMIMHLGHPLLAMNAFFNLGRSWLSREVLFYGGFLGLTFLYLVCNKLNKENLLKPLGIVACILGVCAVFVTSMIYTVPSIMAWNSVNTPLSFALTAIMIGIPLGVYLTNATDLVVDASRLIGTFTLVAITTTLVHTSTLTSSVAAGAGTAHLLLTSPLFWMRLILLSLVCLMSIVVTLRYKGKSACPFNYRLIAIIMLVAAEFIGRTLFLGTIVRM